MSHHTPGKWIVREDPNGKPFYWIKRLGGFVIARVSGRGKGDADRIVQSCNHHEALLEALERIRDGMADDQAYRDCARQALANIEGRN